MHAPLTFKINTFLPQCGEALRLQGASAWLMHDSSGSVLICGILPRFRRECMQYRTVHSNSVQSEQI
eukprot:3635660-Amphidinium_carterae.1